VEQNPIIFSLADRESPSFDYTDRLYLRDVFYTWRLIRDTRRARD